MLSKEEVLYLLNEAKKEVDRLEANHQEDLGNSISHIENELQPQRVLPQVEVYERVLGQLITHQMREKQSDSFI